MFKAILFALALFCLFSCADVSDSENLENRATTLSLNSTSSIEIPYINLLDASGSLVVTQNFPETKSIESKTIDSAFNRNHFLRSRLIKIALYKLGLSEIEANPLSLDDLDIFPIGKLFDQTNLKMINTLNTSENFTQFDYLTQFKLEFTSKHKDSTISDLEFEKVLITNDQIYSLTDKDFLRDTKGKISINLNPIHAKTANLKFNAKNQSTAKIKGNLDKESILALKLIDYKLTTNNQILSYFKLKNEHQNLKQTLIISTPDDLKIINIQEKLSTTDILKSENIAFTQIEGEFTSIDNLKNTLSLPIDPNSLGPFDHNKGLWLEISDDSEHSAGSITTLIYLSIKDISAHLPPKIINKTTLKAEESLTINDLHIGDILNFKLKPLRYPFTMNHITHPIGCTIKYCAPDERLDADKIYCHRGTLERTKPSTCTATFENLTFEEYPSPLLDFNFNNRISLYPKVFSPYIDSEALMDFDLTITEENLTPNRSLKLHFLAQIAEEMNLRLLNITSEQNSEFVSSEYSIKKITPTFYDLLEVEITKKSIH